MSARPARELAMALDLVTKFTQFFSKSACIQFCSSAVLPWDIAQTAARIEFWTWEVEFPVCSEKVAPFNALQCQFAIWTTTVLYSSLCHTEYVGTRSVHDLRRVIDPFDFTENWEGQLSAWEVTVLVIHAESITRQWELRRRRKLVSDEKSGGVGILGCQPWMPHDSSGIQGLRWMWELLTRYKMFAFVVAASPPFDTLWYTYM